jgi:hypothetical protein
MGQVNALSQFKLMEIGFFCYGYLLYRQLLQNGLCP